jgi:hypothetical protein
MPIDQKYYLPVPVFNLSQNSDIYCLIHTNRDKTKEVLTFLAGAAVVTIAGQNYALVAGTTVLVTGGVTYSVRNEQDQPARLLAFFPTAMPQVIYDQPPTPIDWEKSRCKI